MIWCSYVFTTVYGHDTCLRVCVGGGGWRVSGGRGWEGGGGGGRGSWVCLGPAQSQCIQTVLVITDM